MIIIPKKDFPQHLNPLGLKRGDKVQLEITDATADYITLDPASLKLHQVRDINEQRPPLVKMPKPKNAATMPLPALKSSIQAPPMAPPPPPAAV